ncbi:MAG: hypothetical protein A2070_03850 [Bdellovibrionales bacterium GWC1_52_8]|nr:MAG: hypothetical protein A2Z97_02245 [Bdellovibrionales bacterium GWB1_52_6]OFZ04085.1 MAG: hypothetical protein A2X97_14885 [Bdellovibrionales bacterium GWA1_52_35]OFZ41224.1 MAG: hypothetical protein A2070_03850 [Bdellovibrionales bacterium GWC1_52_8]
MSVLVTALPSYLLKAAEPGPAGVRQQIEMVIRMRHPTDTRDWWLALGPQAPGVIIQMVEAPEYRENTLHKMRLLQGLSWFAQDSTALDFLKQQAQTTNEELVRQSVIEAVGITQGPKEAEFISKFLLSTDPQTRLAAAEALKRMKDPRASRLLEAHIPNEKMPWVLDRIQGTPPVALRPGRLKPVSSSEDRLSRDLVGSWKGFWIYPQKHLKTNGGLAQRAAVLELKLAGAEVLEGELLLPAQAGLPLSVYRLKAQGKGLAFTGNAKATSDSSEILIEGQLMRRAGILVLEIRFEASTLIVSLIRR